MAVGRGEVQLGSHCNWNRQAGLLIHFPTLKVPLAFLRPSPTEPLRAFPLLLWLLLLRLVLALLCLLAPIVLAAAVRQAVAHLPLPFVEAHHTPLVDLA